MDHTVTTPQIPPDIIKTPGPNWMKLVALLTVLVVLVVGYGFLAKANNWWPHEFTASPTPVLSTSDVDTTGEFYPTNGSLIKLVETERVGFNLDTGKYPLENIKITCSQGASLDYVSNYSFNSPDNYPIGYQADGIGTCTWKNGDYKVTIEIGVWPY